MGTDAALPQAQLLGTLLAQLLSQGIPPRRLRLLPLQLTARAIAQIQELPSIAEAVLPGLGQRFQAPQGPQPPAVQAGSNQSHLLIERIQQPLELGMGEAPTQQLRALTKQPAVAAEQLA